VRDEVQADVSVAELEPALRAELGHRGQRAPRLAGEPPAALLVGPARERVEHRVEVRRHVQAEHLGVVRHVADNGNGAWIDDRHDASQEPRASDAACEHDDVHRAA